MGQARRGRPRKTGARNAKGRLILLPDRGNIRVQARSLAFARFTPALSEAVLVIGTPGIQLTKGRQFRMIAKELDE